MRTRLNGWGDKGRRHKERNMETLKRDKTQREKERKRETLKEREREGHRENEKHDGLGIRGTCL